MINFLNIKYKNFLSTGNIETEYEFNNHKTTLFIGENGAGKSTILDALCFALYGRGYRPIKKGQLVNSINRKGLVVELEFTSFNIPYKIIRGIKPDIFEIYKNGELLDQDVDAREYQKYFEENVLKINFKAFTQVVILGKTSFVPFMQLSTVERRTIVEELLDIGVFGTMATITKEKVSTNKQDLLLASKDLSSSSTRLSDAVAHNVVVEKGNEDKILDLENQIVNLSEKVSEHSRELEDLKSRYDEEKVKLSSQELKNLESSLEKGLTYTAEVNSKISNLSKQIKTYKNQPDKCIECGQPIETHDFSDKINEFEKALEKLNTLKTKAEERKISLRQEISDKKEELQKMVSVRSNIENMKSKMDSVEYLVKDKKNQIKNLKENNPSLIDVTALEEIHEKNKIIVDELENTKNVLAFVQSSLKDDGIKAEVIKKYIPLINKLINQYLEQFEFFVSFELDDQFNETIKSRHRDEFSFTSFSEGQKMRINLAVLFTWREIARLRNSMNTNLLIMDEVLDSSLDMDGIDQFMKIIQSLTDTTNVLIISHRQDLDLHFERIVKFSEEKNFSTYKEI